MVPVTLRDESGSFSKLVGHPRLVYLHNTMNGTQLYDTVLNLFPSLAHSTIVFTDGQVSIIDVNHMQMKIRIFSYNTLYLEWI